MDQTKEWIEDIVIRLGLCPYAAKPYVAEQIRYAVSTASTDEQLIEDFFNEALFLLESNDDDLSTTFLIAPKYTQGIDDFFYVYEWLAETLEEAGEKAHAAGGHGGEDPSSFELAVGGRVQPAAFHPQVHDSMPTSQSVGAALSARSFLTLLIAFPLRAVVLLRTAGRRADPFREASTISDHQHSAT